MCRFKNNEKILARCVDDELEFLKNRYIFSYTDITFWNLYVKSFKSWYN